jgi:hypothetical protein
MAKGLLYKCLNKERAVKELRVFGNRMDWRRNRWCKGYKRGGS